MQMNEAGWSYVPFQSWSAWISPMLNAALFWNPFWLITDQDFPRNRFPYNMVISQTIKTLLAYSRGQSLDNSCSWSLFTTCQVADHFCCVKATSNLPAHWFIVNSYQTIRCHTSKTSEPFFSLFVCKMIIFTSINSFLGCKMGEEWTVRTIGDNRDRSSVLCSSEGFHCRQNHHG